MVDMEMTMTFEEALEVVKEYTGCGNLLLDGLEQIQREIEEEDGYFGRRDVGIAFHVICTKMRPLFV
jgi:hypothetical protein